MAFFYSTSTSTRFSLPASSSSSSSSAAATSSTSLLQQPPNPPLQNQYEYQQMQPTASLGQAMDSSCSTSSSSSHHYCHQAQRQQQAQQQSPRPLQGPRPSPLKVRKDSYKIKKPPMAPGGHQHHQPSGLGPQQHQQSQLPRQPVIIYTVSPKVIHTKPGDFMSLVQRLTGVNSSPTAAATAAAESQPSPGAFPSPGPAGAMSPAAKLATIEKAHQQSAAEYQHHPYRSSTAAGGDDVDRIMEQFQSSSSASGVLDYRAGNNNLPFPPPAILSPNPSSLPAISPSFFDLNSLGFLQDFLSGLSPMAAPVTTAPPAMPDPPVVAASGTTRSGFIDNSFLLSPPASGSHLGFPAPSPGGGLWPSGLGFTPTAGAPSPSWDVFGSFPDL